MTLIASQQRQTGHTKGDSTLAESSTGNTRLADRFLHETVGFLLGLTDYWKTSLDRGSIPELVAHKFWQDDRPGDPLSDDRSCG